MVNYSFLVFYNLSCMSLIILYPSIPVQSLSEYNQHQIVFLVALEVPNFLFNGIC